MSRDPTTIFLLFGASSVTTRICGDRFFWLVRFTPRSVWCFSVVFFREKNSQSGTWKGKAVTVFVTPYSSSAF